MDTPHRKLTARQIFNHVYQGQKNFMTPKRLKYFQTKYHAIELAQGTGIMHQNIYGVSLIDITPDREGNGKESEKLSYARCKESEKLFQSLTSALYYVGRIKENDTLSFMWCQDSQGKSQENSLDQSGETV